MYKTVEDFIEYNTSTSDLCHNYKKYNKEVQNMLKNVYVCCFRFCLYKAQTIHMLNESLKSFKMNKDEELFGLK